MASAKKSKKVLQKGVTPTASEPRRTRESGTKLSVDAGRSKSSRATPTGAPRIKLGLLSKPETSELKVSAGSGRGSARQNSTSMDVSSNDHAKKRVPETHSVSAPNESMKSMPRNRAAALRTHVQGRGTAAARRAVEPGAIDIKHAETAVARSETATEQAGLPKATPTRRMKDKLVRSAAEPKPVILADATTDAPGASDACGLEKKSTEATTTLENLDAPVRLAPMSNDRKQVTKKDENKPGAGQAPAVASDRDVGLEATGPVTAASVGGPAAKPAIRVPTPKASSVPEPTIASKSPAKPPATPKPSERAAAATAKSGKASGASRHGFKPLEFIVYPAHGVGQIVAIDEQEVAGFKLELFVISFIKDKMILKVPTSKAAIVGMRKLADADIVKKAFDTLGGRARVKRTMWSRRAQEYEAKINSGDLVAIAEVVRDLYRSDTQPEQSYSERQLYEAALDRMTREIIVVQKLTETEALRAIEAQLLKGPRRGGKVEEIDPDDDTDIEEAA
jgi:CarD family transcriptional regulator